MPNMGNNLGAGGTKLKWYSLKMLNRIPQVELERKLNEIGRLYAAIKRESRIEEGQLWEFLFDSYNLLKKSIARFPQQDIEEGLVQIVRPRGEKDEPVPYSEVYRQFIIYKARVSVKVFGADKLAKRPRYKDLYRKMQAPRQNNTKNVEALLAKFNAQYEENEKVLAVLKSPGIEYNDLDDVDDAASSRRLSIKRSSLRSQKREFTTGDIMPDPILPDRSNQSETTRSHSVFVREEVEVPLPGKPLILPPVFLTVPHRMMESEERPPADSDNTKKRESIGHRLMLPKVDE